MCTIIIVLYLIIIQSNSSQVDKYLAIRNKMVDAQIKERGITNISVIKAMRKIPRHLFVPEEYTDDAYGDYPVPIGHGQTISQPYIVAYMTEVVKPSKNKKVLEIGTGSGYQAAVLAEITDTVYTIEIIPELAAEASALLQKLEYKNIIVRSGDGYNGWTEHAPFDIIVVTAAAANIPQPLIDQLAEGGRFVIPVGKPGAIQELKLVTRKNGRIETTRLIYVRFVPFRRSSATIE